MATIVLISCVSKKLSHSAKAKDLYISTLFTSAMRYAQTFSPDKIYILSAKYGLLELEEQIEPYDLTLNNMRSAEKKAWAKEVLEQLRKVTDFENDKFVFLAGENYRKHLLPHLKNYSLPLKGLGIGKQLKFLKEKNEANKA